MGDWSNVITTSTKPSSSIQSKFAAQAQYWNSSIPSLVGPLKSTDIAPHLTTAIDGLIDIISPSTSVLDFGCGIGRIYEALSPKCQYSGIDISEGYINIAKAAHSNVPWILMTSQYIPFEDNAFDLAIAYSVLTHIPADEQCSLIMSELYRVLKPKGVLLVSAFINQRPGANWIIYTEEYWDKIVLDTGFHKHKVTSVPEDSYSHQSLYTLIK